MTITSPSTPRPPHNGTDFDTTPIRTTLVQVAMCKLLCDAHKVNLIYSYYNDMSSEDARNPEVLRNGIHSKQTFTRQEVTITDYAKRPVTSRAHLLDIAAFIERHQLPALSFFDTSTPIPLDYLRRCASESNVVFRSGDILLVRTGFTEKYLATSEAELRKLSERAKRGWVGIQQGEQTLRWHWDNGIAAVASDT